MTNASSTTSGPERIGGGDRAVPRPGGPSNQQVGVRSNQAKTAGINDGDRSTPMHQAMHLYAQMAGRLHWLVLAEDAEREEYLSGAECRADRERWRAEAKELFKGLRFDE